MRCCAGDPICFLQPVSVATIEAAEPVVRELAEEPTVEVAFRAWATSRDAFNADSARSPREWQKHYYQGKRVTGEAAPAHRTRVRLASFGGVPQADDRPLAERLAAAEVYFTKAAEFPITEVDDGFTLTDADGVAHSLNNSAMFILECCTGEERAADIAAKLQAAYGLPERPDELVGRCLAELLAAGLISA